MKNKDKMPDTEAQLEKDELELNTCSLYDCTGLIPAGITNEAEAEAYEELYPYLTPPSSENEEDKQ